MEHLLDFTKEVSVYVVTAVMAFIALEIRKCSESVNSLNQKIAVLLERLSYHEKQIEKHDRRISQLEKD